MSEPFDPDSDLRDVFSLLYADEEWAFDELSDEEATPKERERDDSTVTGGDEVHPPLDSAITVPDTGDEVEVVERAVTEELDTNALYTRKRFFDALDSLFLPAATDDYHDQIGKGGKKRRRIYPTVLPSTPSLISSTQPIPTLPAANVYAPYSPLALLSRLRTYQTHTYPPLLPSSLAPVNAALNGWTNDSPFSLACGTCKARWSIAGVNDIADERVREEVARRLSKGFAERHAKSCPWRLRASPDTLHTQLLKLLHPSLSSNLGPLSEAISTSLPSSTLSDLFYKSPITSTEEEILFSSLVPFSDQGTSSTPSRPSSTLALFGWYPYHPNEPSDHVPNHTLSGSSGIVMGTSTKPTSSTGKSRQTEIVQCRVCERRIGLWGFTNTGTGTHDVEKGGKKFDLVAEHLDWCPIRSSTKEPMSGRGWWEDLPLLRHREKAPSTTEGGGGAAWPVGGWVTVSDKLEKKPWRRV